MVLYCFPTLTLTSLFLMGCEGFEVWSSGCQNGDYACVDLIAGDGCEKICTVCGDTIERVSNRVFLPLESIFEKLYF